MNAAIIFPSDQISCNTVRCREASEPSAVGVFVNLNKLCFKNKQQAATTTTTTTTTTEKVW